MESSHQFGFVALVGPPNAGKSTLMNAYLGQKVAIVSPKPQTTRNRISGILTRDDCQIVFLDTPGVHRLRGRMNRMLLDAAWSALAGADVVTLILDAGLYAAKPGLLDKDLGPLVKPVNESGRPVILAVNKVDKVKDKPRLLPVLEEVSSRFPGAEIVPVSALKGDGLEQLLQTMLKHLPQSPSMFPEDQISTVPMRFMASEIVREKLFMRLHQELPYSTAVEIEFYEEKPDFDRIGAVIFVSRKNHKGMVIGKQGQTLKAVGTEARMELQDMLGKKVHLELWVKVREGWTEDQGFLTALGLAGE